MTNGSHGRKTLLHSEHAITDTCIGCVDCNNGIPHGQTFQIERLDQEKLFPLVALLFPGCNHVSDDACNDHASLSIWSTMATTAASVGTSAGLNANAASRPRQT